MSDQTKAVKIPPGLVVRRRWHPKEDRGKCLLCPAAGNLDGVIIEAEPLPSRHYFFLCLDCARAIGRCAHG